MRQTKYVAEEEIDVEEINFRKLMNFVDGLNYKIKDMSNNLQTVHQLMEDEVYYSPSDISKILKCSVHIAKNIFNRPDFPKVELSPKMFRVSRTAFFAYMTGRHIMEDYEQ